MTTPSQMLFILTEQAYAIIVFSTSGATAAIAYDMASTFGTT
jgi:hypothetical protein